MRKWIPLIAVCLGTFMLLVDVTIVNVALPDMAKDLSTSFTSLQWVVDAYALILAALVLGTGSIADIVGHREAYVAGLALFAIASLVCGLAPNASVLIAARAVQGLGGAAMFATTFALLNSNYSGRDRGTAYGMWGAVVSAAAAVGPIVGGLLTEGISWRWIFFVNLPISVAAIAMCVLVLKDVHESRRARVDWLGITTFTAAAAGVTYALIHGNEYGWTGPQTWAVGLAGLVLFGVFVIVELRTPHAMLDLALMRNRSFVGICVAAILLTFAAFASFTYTQIWLQSVIGLSPIEAGLTGLPLTVASFTVSAFAGRYLISRPPGPVIAGGLALIALGDLVGFALVHGDARWAALLPGFFLAGIGVGMAVPVLSSAGMAAVPIERGGMAAGAVNTARQLGFAFGIALLGTVFSARISTVLTGRSVSGANSVAHQVSGGQAARVLGSASASGRQTLEQAVHASAVSGLQFVFLVAGIVGLVAAVLTFVLVRPAAEASQAEHAHAPEPAPA
jgi:EmrB/QacA subfamily drug resistance transporter